MRSVGSERAWPDVDDFLARGYVDSPSLDPSFTRQLNGKYPDSNQLTHFKEIFQLNFAVGSELTNETGVRCGSFSVASYSMAIFHVDQSNRIGM